MTSRLRECPGNRVEGEGDCGEPGDQLPTDATGDNVEYHERNGKRHEVVAIEILLEDKTQAERHRYERDERYGFEYWAKPLQRPSCKYHGYDDWQDPGGEQERCAMEVEFS